MQLGLLAGGIVLVGITVFFAATWRDRRVIPLVAHNFPWSVALLVAGSGLIYYDVLETSALALIFVGIGFFNLGILVSARFKRRTNTHFTGHTRGAITMRLYIAISVGFSIGFATLLWTIQRLFGLSVLFTDPQAIRMYSDIQYLQEFPLWGKVLFYLGPLIVALTVNPSMVSGLERIKPLLRALIVAVVLLAQAASLQRTNIFVSVFLAFAVFVYRRRLSRMKVKEMAIAGTLVLSICVVAFFGIAIAIGKTSSGVSGSAQYFAPSIRGSEVSQALYYGSSGVIGFGLLSQSNDRRWPPPYTGESLLLGDFNPQTWGAATFPFVLKAIPGARPFPEVEPFTETPLLTNAYTWLSPWYRDFRLPGLVVFPFLVALLAGYAAFQSAKSEAWSFLAGLLTSSIIWAPFTNRFLSTMTVELFGIGLLLLYLERRRAASD